VAFEGKRLLNSSQLPPMVGTTSRVDQPARHVLRDGKEMQLSVKSSGACRTRRRRPRLPPARRVETEPTRSSASG
jgi:hypothetical protein